MEKLDKKVEKDFFDVFLGILKMTGIFMLTWIVLLMQRAIFNYCYYINELKLNYGENDAGMISLLIESVFSLIVLIMLTVIFIKMMKRRFGANNLIKIILWTLTAILVITFLLGSGFAFSMSKNSEIIDLNYIISIFFKTGILNGIKGTELVGILLTISLFSIKVYEKNSQKSIFSIIYAAISSVILIITYYFVSFFLDVYMYQIMTDGNSNYVWKFIMEIIKNTNMFKVIFNYYFYIVVLVIIIFTIILILNVYSENTNQK